MSASQFTDKQIMERSGSGVDVSGGGDFLELLDGRRQNNGAEDKKDDIVPGYDFQPIRKLGSSPPSEGSKMWTPPDSAKIGSSNVKVFGSSNSNDSSKVVQEKNKEAHNAAILDELDHTVKKYVDTLLHALEGVGSRLSKLEARTEDLEIVMDDLKLAIANNDGSTDRKLRQLGNIITEVQSGVQILCDKQENVEARMQLGKLHFSRDHQLQETAAVGPSEPVPQHVHSPQLSPHVLQPTQNLLTSLPPPHSSQPPPTLSMPPAPDAAPLLPLLQRRQHNPPSAQFSSHVLQHQFPSVPSMPMREPYFPPPSQPLPEVPRQLYQPPLQQTPPQQYPPAPAQLQSYSQLPPSSQPNPSRCPAPLPHHPEETSLHLPPPQTYPPTNTIMHQPPQLPSGPPQSNGSASSMYEPPKIGLVSGQQSSAGGYGPSNSYAYGSGSPPHYNSGTRPSPFFSSFMPHLPTTQVLPQAPTAAGGSSSSGGNEAPIDDVVDKVAAMGFPRDLARATAWRLTEDGQNVNLNTVLDKLMNGNQPGKGWFGR